MSSGPCRIRTRDPGLKRPLLYQTELTAHAGSIARRNDLSNSCALVALQDGFFRSARHEVSVLQFVLHRASFDWNSNLGQDAGCWHSECSRTGEHGLTKRAKFVYYIGIEHVGAWTGRGAVWLARYNGVVEVPGSNPGAPTEQVFTFFRARQERMLQPLLPRLHSVAPHPPPAALAKQLRAHPGVWALSKIAGHGESSYAFAPRVWLGAEQVQGMPDSTDPCRAAVATGSESLPSDRLD